MEKNIKESELVEIVVEHLEKQGYTVEREVKLSTKFIDIVARKEETIAVEVKVKNWQRAFQQALTYRFGADRVFVALPEDILHRIDRKRFVEKGIGIIAIKDGSVKIIVEAKKQNMGKKVEKYKSKKEE